MSRNSHWSLLVPALALLVIGNVQTSGPRDRAGHQLPRRVAAQLATMGVGGKTTLDGDIQRAVDGAMDEGVARARSLGLFPSGGAAVVIDLARRAVVGLTSVPEDGRMRAIESVPPGSIMKPFTALAALGAGIDPRRIWPCPERLSIRGSTVSNWRRADQPAMRIPEALADSCNTVFAGIAATLWDTGNAKKRSAIGLMLRRFHFGLRTGLIPTESPGRLPVAVRSLGELMVLSIGQGPVLVTPLQVAAAYASIARSDPRLVDIVGNGLESQISTPPLVQLDHIREGLVLAVRQGTAQKSFVDVDLDRFPIAGKTGSAEVGDAIPYAWFVSYAPATAPRYVVVVLVERGRTGAISAAPIARSILDHLFELPRKPAGPPLPSAAFLFVSVALLAGLASPAAGSLVGVGLGALTGGLTGGSVATNALTFSIAGWLVGNRRSGGGINPWFLAVAVAVSSLALPAPGRGISWIAARALVSVAIAMIAFAIVMTAKKRLFLSESRGD